jgi:hypothetical protein
MKALQEGPYIRHFPYGLGVTAASDAERMLLDFDLHGLKEFVAKIMVVELTEGTPGKRSKRPETQARRTYSRREMNHGILVQFVGFQSKRLGREYTFTVRESSMEPREFTLTIASEAFNDRRVRYQDAPDICSLKLRHELEKRANCPTGTHFDITDQDLEDYRSSHSPRTARSPYCRRPV